AFPNPTQEVLMVTMNAIANDATLSLVDMTGRVVWSTNIAGASHAATQIDMAAFEAGMYFVRMEAEGAQSVLRILKQ
ncbi:T9SS type A sorting domain-containing protein, partial [bacterium]|nr:T9SS type A sorting domain-containing protein [bacterium]MDA8978968.1 T9SS type A sorting domain-containing protein [bacterium]